jgi:large subunit ribosomal protein L17
MRGTPKKGRRFGGAASHQNAMMSNLVASLIAGEALTTTVAKAKLLKPMAEKVISAAKKGDVHHHRLVVSLIRDKEMAHKLFSEIAPRYEDRNGGYVRIIRAGYRKGDNAPLARVELI